MGIGGRLERLMKGENGYYSLFKCMDLSNNKNKDSSIQFPQISIRILTQKSNIITLKMLNTS